MHAEPPTPALKLPRSAIVQGQRPAEAAMSVRRVSSQTTPHNNVARHKAGRF